MYVCIYIYIYMSVCACMFVTIICMYLRMYLRMYVCTYIYVYMYVRMYACTCMSTNACIHYTRICRQVQCICYRYTSFDTKGHENRVAATNNA